MTTVSKPLSRLLLPVDTLAAFKRAAPLAGLLIRTLALPSRDIDMLHVVAGAFLSEHMNTIDIAAGEVPTAEDMRYLRQRHLDDEVMPLLSRAGALLQDEAGGLTAGLLIKDGDPVRKISEVCRDGAYSTLVMSRRNRTEISGRLTGSVVAGILHRHAEATLYLVGDEPIAQNASPFARCLIGIDGSPASRSAVAEAALLLPRLSEDVEKVFLVHVLDQSCYYDEDGETCIQASETGQQSLEEAGNTLIAAGVEQAKITTVIHFGKPGTILAEEAIGCGATTIFIGRRDRSRMAQVFLGSVCTDMIQNCRERTIVLSS